MKTMTTFLRYATLGALVLSIAFTSCRRKTKDELEPDPDLTTEKDLSNADGDMNSIINDIDRVSSSATVNARTEATATYTLSALKDTSVGTFDKYVVVTYTGDGYDGLGRSGMIILYLKSGATRAKGNYEDSAVFSGTKVDGRSITGWKYTKQVASGSSDAWKFQITAKGKIANQNGALMDYVSTRTRVRTGVSSPLLFADDTWTITGSWSGTNSIGESVTANISSPIVLNGNCSVRRPVSGKIDFTNNSLGITRSIDYGAGACDFLAVFTNSRGREFTFAMR